MREQASSMYDVSPYFFGKVLAEIPFTTPQPLVITLIMYWAIPLNADPGAFFVFCTIKFFVIVCLEKQNDNNRKIVAAMFFGYQVGVSYALLMGSLLSDREALINIAPVFIFSFPLKIYIADKHSTDVAIRILRTAG